MEEELLPPDQEISPEEINARADQFNRYWENTHPEAEFELAHLGFSHLERPRFTCPTIDPQRLTSADLSSYATMHAQMQAWHNYAENTLSIIESMLITVRRQMEQLLPQLKIEYGRVKNPSTNRRYNIDDRKALAENTPRYIELLRNKTKLEAQQKLMESYAKGLGRDCALISRHIEIRKLDMEQGRTGQNMPSRGMYNR
jgi:hypothetical protein